MKKHLMDMNKILLATFVAAFSCSSFGMQAPVKAALQEKIARQQELLRELSSYLVLVLGYSEEEAIAEVKGFLMHPDPRAHFLVALTELREHELSQSLSGDSLPTRRSILDEQVQLIQFLTDQSQSNNQARKNIPNRALLSNGLIMTDILNAAIIIAQQKKEMGEFLIKTTLLGSKEAVAYILNNPCAADIDAVETWAHIIESGNVASLRLLLEAGVDLNALADREGRTLLHLAVLNQQKELVRLLLKKGANPNIADKHKSMPIDDALYFLNSAEEKGCLCPAEEYKSACEIYTLLDRVLSDYRLSAEISSDSDDDEMITATNDPYASQSSSSEDEEGGIVEATAEEAVTMLDEQEVSSGDEAVYESGSEDDELDKCLHGWPRSNCVVCGIPYRETE